MKPGSAAVGLCSQGGVSCFDSLVQHDEDTYDMYNFTSCQAGSFFKSLYFKVQQDQK